MSEEARIRISGPRVVAQVRYRSTPAASVTAAAIVARKCRNCAALLTKVLPYQRQLYPERARVLRQAIATLDRIVEHLQVPPTNTRDLFLVEARAARAYWDSVGTLLALHDPHWTRRYPHMKDPVNVLLNTGYTLLARWVRDAILSAGLLPEVGVFHATVDGKEPLVYDLMEPFRQPAIDAVVIPLFTKKKRPVIALAERDIRRAVARFHEQWEWPFWYRGRCLPLRRIAEAEVISLSRAMVRGTTWEPYRHPWGHGWTCVGYRLTADAKKRLHREAAVADE